MGFIRDITPEVSIEERRESCILHYTLPVEGRSTPVEHHAEIAYEHLPDVIRALSETAGRKITGETGKAKPELRADVVQEAVQRQVNRLREAHDQVEETVREIGKLLGHDLELDGEMM